MMEEEELDEGQQLFIALLEGDDKEIEDKLYHYVYGNEYCLAHDGGEPDLEDVLAIKLLEKLRVRKMYGSIIYSDRYLEHKGIKVNEKENDRKQR